MKLEVNSNGVVLKDLHIDLKLALIKRFFSEEIFAKVPLSGVPLNGE